VTGFWPIFKREMLALFVTPLAWVLITTFLMVQGIHVFILVSQYATSADIGVVPPNWEAMKSAMEVICRARANSVIRAMMGDPNEKITTGESHRRSTAAPRPPDRPMTPKQLE